MALPIRRASVGQCFTMAPGFVTYENTPAKAITARNVLSTTDTWHELNEADFWGLCESLQIPRAAINVITGTGATTRTWSRANDAVERSEKILEILSATEVVTPPKA